MPLQISGRFIPVIVVRLVICLNPWEYCYVMSAKVNITPLPSDGIIHYTEKTSVVLSNDCLFVSHSARQLNTMSINSLPAIWNTQLIAFLQPPRTSMSCLNCVCGGHSAAVSDTQHTTNGRWRSHWYGSRDVSPKKIHTQLSSARETALAQPPCVYTIGLSTAL
jgi:hypothetical protein